jgi:hypothetical protein
MGCGWTSESRGERLARTYCAACHAFPEPGLLDKKTWQSGVLPQMALRLGVSMQGAAMPPFRNPYMAVLSHAISQTDFDKIVAYYHDAAPDSLPYQSWPVPPTVDPIFFSVSPFAANVPSSGIITLLKIDSASQRIFVGEGGTNALHVFDFKGQLRSTTTLGSPPTDLLVEGNHVLVLESGILDPNDEAKGSLVQYDSSLGNAKVLIDSLLRPVFVRRSDSAFVICEFGNNRGRLAVYLKDGERYRRQVLEATPGAIRFELRDLTGDGRPDLIVLFAQGDERIELFENDGKGSFTGARRVLARFPPVYGSMYFAMDDFNGDGHLDIVYVNGDNFDYSRVLKPYHGVRILENDGKNNFRERYFFPVYGAARAEVADFDRDGDLDIVVTSNFADFKSHPERGIVYLENLGGYQFKPFVFSAASSNQWNLTAAADLNGDGWPDMIVGSMNLENIARRQRGRGGQTADSAGAALLLFQSRIGLGAR